MAEAVLLTGATGFVGRAILAALRARGVAVEAVAHRGEGRPAAAVRWHGADLLDEADRRRLVREAGAATLIHAAWSVEHGRFWEAPENVVWRDASEDLCRRFLDGGGRRLVVLGTCAEYAPFLGAGDGELWPETRAVAPASAYGRAKADLCERLSAAAGAALLWLRLFHLFGPGEHPARFVPGLVAALREGRPAEVRAAGLVRDFASTRHVGEVVAGLGNAAVGGAVNVGSGRPLSLGDVGRIVAGALDRPDLLRLSDGASAGQPPVMAPDLQRARAVLGPAAEEDVEAALFALAGAGGGISPDR